MVYKTLHLQDKWFSEAAPTVPKKSTATLTFDGIPVVAEVVVVGTEVYEFVAAAANVAD